MKKTIFALTMLFATGACIMAQSQDTVKTEKVQYYFFTNNIPSDFNYPLVGLVNNVDGNHASLQVGIVNSTKGNFGGLQVGFINSVGRQTTGVQSGFINSVNGDFYGIQSGFINSTSSYFRGIQSGFINSNAKTNIGIQYGFINSNNKTVGVQSGFVNSSSEGTTGVQTGFINSTGELKGLQTGFINNAKSLRGLQLGFINSVDNVEKGLPIGFLSFVKHGGFKAIEVAYNNVYPLNVAFKTGVREFYTYPMLSYDWRLGANQMAFGYGIGSNLDINNRLFINPEMEWLQQVSLDFNHYSIFKCNFGYSINDYLELVAGPSLVWQFKINANDFHQNYTIWNPQIVAINKLKAGFNLAVRFKF